ncbi:MAG TPA: hypothetical protein VGL21_13555 [Jatrophihabitantaceae bacterium]|jgi:hypothetical protein
MNRDGTRPKPVPGLADLYRAIDGSPLDPAERGRLLVEVAALLVGSAPADKERAVVESSGVPRWVPLAPGTPVNGGMRP